MSAPATYAFTIITATYNAGPLLDRTVASLAAQTYTNFQWLVIDGNSNDDTIDRVKRAGSIVDRWVSEPDEGIADAWNKGITLARGESVLILNAGDEYDADFLRCMADNRDGQRIICSHARLVGADGNRCGVFKAQPQKLGRAMHLPHNWCAVPAHHYRALGEYSKIPLAMDFDWFHRYYRTFGTAGFKIVDRVLGTYYLGGASDVSYRASFKANEKILLANGMHPLVARFHRLTYTLKHTLRYALAR